MGLKTSTAFAPPELLYRVPADPTDDDGTAASHESAAAVSAGAGPGGILRARTRARRGRWRREEDEDHLQGIAAQAPRVPGGAGWRVRAVDESGVAIEKQQRGAFAPLVADPSFDVWSFGALLASIKQFRLTRFAVSSP